MSFISHIDLTKGRALDNMNSGGFPMYSIYNEKNKIIPYKSEVCGVTEECIDKFSKKFKDFFVVFEGRTDGKLYQKYFTDAFRKTYVGFYRIYKGGDEICAEILYLPENSESILKIENFLLGFSNVGESNKGTISLLTKDPGGMLDLTEQTIACPEIDFDLNYNEGFENIHDKIVKEVSAKDGKGLILLSGYPGTGKTTYLRYLANKIEKRIIYLPPSMSEVLSDPGIVSFLSEYPNSIILLEDAENVLMERNAGSGQAVSNILNLTDGILGDCLKIQIIATFNADIGKIDKALVRKGRLKMKYEFEKLSEDRAKKLADKLGINLGEYNSLADIYNTEENGNIEKGKIGFKNS